MEPVSADLRVACARYCIARDAYFSGAVSDRTEDLRRSWISAAVQVAELSVQPVPHRPLRSRDGEEPLAVARDILGAVFVLAIVASIGAWLFPLLFS